VVPVGRSPIGAANNAIPYEPKRVRRNYMPPELIALRPTDRRLDVFAFGVTAYRTCSLAFPWPESGTTVAVLNQ
jgi:hypothetical protein